MDVQNEILDYLGSEATVEMLHQEYDGKSVDEILADLNSMFPSDDNADLAQKIYDYCD